MIKSYEPSLVGIPFLQKDVSTNLFPRISQRAHIKYFIQFRVSPLLPLLAHHTECHLYFVFSSLVSGKCSKWNVTLSPWIWHLSLPMCNSMLTTRSAHNSGLDIDKPSHWQGHCPHCPNVWSRGYKGNAHTENSKARPELVLLYLNILVFQLR